MSINYRLSFSLLALDNLDDLDALFSLLRKKKITFVELPITKFFPKYKIEKKKINFLKRKLQKYNLKISSVQSIFHQTNLNIFDKHKKKEIHKHLNKIIKICDNLNVSNIIFGSPKNRRKGKLKKKEADKIFSKILFNISKKLIKKRINFCIEPNARYYGCDYLFRYSQVLNFIKRLNVNNVHINFDTGNAKLENDYLSKNTQHIKNFQISEKNLKELNIKNHKHLNYLNSLINNKSFISLEMLNIKFQKIEKNLDNFNFIIKNSVNYIND